MPEEFIAHVRESDKKKQLLQEHLEGVASLAKSNASKIGIGSAGELIGLLHDLGKYSLDFQRYLLSATNILEPNFDEDYVDSKELKGKIDHSTAGAQLIWRELSYQGPLGKIVGQILSLCIASHHSGLIDCLSTDLSEGVDDNFSRRMGKSDARSHLDEAFAQGDDAVKQRITCIMKDPVLIDSLKKIIGSIIQISPEKMDNSLVAKFHIGLLVRFLFSCLVDADGQDSADFEKDWAARQRMHGEYTGWDVLVNRIENHLQAFPVIHPIDHVRKDISIACKDAAKRDRQIFTLTVPTGGGKTLASLRFALHHAQKHKLDRIIYVIPFTTIIDQNAKVAREVLEPEIHPEERGRVVIEHHSNLGPERQNWRGKILAETWDAPVIFTTSVQLLEALFGNGTRGARRMHQLARAVIVFDEIQTLPIRCVHLFNNAVNFLVDHCGSSVVLCTATQPLLYKVDEKKGVAKLSQGSEIMPSVQGLFESLKRVNVYDKRKPGGWAYDEIADQAMEELKQAGSCLVVVNTKKAAKELYRSLEGCADGFLFHLSTSMCPAHRKKTLADIHENLKNRKPVLCISTQLIEAGVDVDFGAVIRFAAGLDSIAQAAGRCNRNGIRKSGRVLVVNPADDDLKRLDDIRIGRENAERLLDDFKDAPDRFHFDLIGPQAMEFYYQNYFFDRKKEMDYPVKADKVGRDDTLLNMLSINQLAVADYSRRTGSSPAIYMTQSFKAAAEAFKAIDAPTQGVIVPYSEDGIKIIGALCSAFEVKKHFALLRSAQQFTVNVFPHEFEKLVKQGALHDIQEGIGIYYLNECFYSKHFGLSIEPVAKEELLNA